jgi:hypothetical protein
LSVILSSLPYLPQPLIVRGKLWRRPSPHQIFLWISVTQTGIDRADFPADATVFPALLDTGCACELLIQEELLLYFTDLRAHGLPYLRDNRLNGIPVPFHEADIWIHGNRQGERDVLLPDEKPFPIRCRSGVGI